MQWKSMERTGPSDSTLQCGGGIDGFEVECRRAEAFTSYGMLHYWKSQI